MESDKQLVNRIVHADNEAAQILIERYQSAALATAYGVLRDYHLAQDVTQEAFLVAFNNIKALKEGSRFGGWLLAIVRREAIRKAKARVRRAAIESSLATNETNSVSEKWNSLDTELMACLSQLPDHERAIVTLKYFEGLSIEEIVTVTGLSTGTVTKQLSRAYARLRKLIKEIDQ